MFNCMLVVFMAFMLSTACAVFIAPYVWVYIVYDVFYLLIFFAALFAAMKNNYYYAAVLIGRITGLASQSVCLHISVSLSCTDSLLEIKKRRKTQIRVNVPQSRGNGCDNFQLKRLGLCTVIGSGRQGCAALGGRPHNISALATHICLVMMAVCRRRSVSGRLKSVTRTRHLAAETWSAPTTTAASAWSALRNVSVCRHVVPPITTKPASCTRTCLYGDDVTSRD